MEETCGALQWKCMRMWDEDGDEDEKYVRDRRMENGESMRQEHIRSFTSELYGCIGHYIELWLIKMLLASRKRREVKRKNHMQSQSECFQSVSQLNNGRHIQTHVRTFTWEMNGHHMRPFLGIKYREGRRDERKRKNRDPFTFFQF